MVNDLSTGILGAIRQYSGLTVATGMQGVYYCCFHGRVASNYLDSEKVENMCVSIRYILAAIGE